MKELPMAAGLSTFLAQGILGILRASRLHIHWRCIILLLKAWGPSRTKSEHGMGT